MIDGPDNNNNEAVATTSNAANAPLRLPTRLIRSATTNSNNFIRRFLIPNDEMIMDTDWSDSDDDIDSDGGVLICSNRAGR